MKFPELLYQGLPGETHRQSSNSFTTNDIDRVITWAKHAEAQPARKVIQTPIQEIVEPRLRFGSDSNPIFEPVTWSEFTEIFTAAKSGFNYKPHKPNNPTRHHYFISISTIEDRYNQYNRPTTRPNFEVYARQKHFKGIGTTDWHQIESWMDEHRLQPIGRQRTDGLMGLYFADKNAPSTQSIAPDEFMDAFSSRGLALVLQGDRKYAFFARKRLIWPEIFPPTGAQPR